MRRILSIVVPAAIVAVLFYALLRSDAILNTLDVQLSAENHLVLRRVVGTALGLSLMWLCFRLLDVCLWWAIVERRTGRAAPRLLVAMLRVAVAILAVCLVVAYVFEQPLTGVLVSSGVVGIVLGFALQKTISDFFSGIALNVERSFAIGDWVEIDGVTGMVTEVNWRATHLITLDKVTVVVPNSHIAENRILNYSTPQPSFRAHLAVSLEYGVPTDHAKRVLMAAVQSVPGVLGRPRPDVLLVRFGADGLDYDIRFYVANYADLTGVSDAVACAVNHHLFQAGLGVPYPKRDVYYAPMPPRELDRRADRDVLLGRIDLFAELDNDFRERLADALAERRFVDGDRIVHQGDEGSSLFLIVEGLVEVRMDDGQRSYSVARLGPGDFFGEMSLLTGEPRSATVVALADALLYELAQSELAPLLRERPELADALSQALTERRIASEAASGVDDADTHEKRRRTRADLLRRIQRLFRIDG